RVGDMRDDVAHLAGERLRVARAVDLGAAARRARDDAVKTRTRPALLAEDDLALIDVAGDDDIEIVRRGYRIEVGKLDRRTDVRDRGERRSRRGAPWQVARHAHRDLRLGDRTQVVLQRHRRAA